MPDLSFDIDWVDADGVGGPELSATWASLRICAGDSVITRVLDTRARTVRDYIHVPLYPLAEWLVTNWWFLLHECTNPAKEGDPDFHRRHALRFGREGYAFPDLEMVSSGARTRLMWKRDRHQWSGVEFLDQGIIWVDSGRFQEACAALVDQVIRRLDTLDVGETFLEEEWNAIQSTDEEESRFCEIAEEYDLFHGWQVLQWVVEGYDTSLRFGQREHNIKNITFAMADLMAVNTVNPMAHWDHVFEELVSYALIDGLIGNTDRHHENWMIAAVVYSYDMRIQVMPSFDHASSLGRELTDDRRRNILESDGVLRYLNRGRGPCMSTASTSGRSLHFGWHDCYADGILGSHGEQWIESAVSPTMRFGR